MRQSALLLTFVLILVSGCSGSRMGANLARGPSAYDLIPALSSAGPAEDYKIGSLDLLDITVFQEPDLSVKAATVDAFGSINLPLIGDVIAAGKTANEFSRELATKLGEKYLERPQVSVVVSVPVAQKVVVQGEVVQPGIYEIKGPTTLLGALALASGETRVAALDEVVVFRILNGQRQGAVFDVAEIRSGRTADPEIVTNDMVVVGFSNAKRVWNDVLSSIPLLNIFRPF